MRGASSRAPQGKPTMKNIFAISLIVLALGISAVCAEAPAMPRIFANARFVYVTSYDGGELNPNILPEDRDAIARVESGIQKWGKLTLVLRPEQADIILAVESRGSEDVLAAYDAHRSFAGSRPDQTYLWRVMSRSGLQKGEMPLFTEFEQAFAKIANQ
jgi:hypothetical protein